MFGPSKTEMERVVEQAVRRVLDNANEEVKERLAGFRTVAELNEEILVLKEDLSDLHIQKSRREEEFAKREREVEHKVGLERKRQAFEVEQAKREAVVEVREENLAADKDRFKEEMEFQRERLEGEIESLRKLTEKLLERLPSAEIFATIGGGKDD